MPHKHYFLSNAWEVLCAAARIPYQNNRQHKLTGAVEEDKGDAK